MAIQLTCPFCHREFPYENEQMDQKLHDIGMNIELTKMELQKFKTMRPEEKNQETWKERQYLISRLNKLMKDYRELKAVRNQAEYMRDRLENKAFKTMVKELVGDVEYKNLWDRVNEEMKAYDIKHLMKHDYTRSLPNTTNINKI